MKDEKQLEPLEPGKTPGKAEGARDPRDKPSLEPGRTPGKAEGEREPFTPKPSR